MSEYQYYEFQAIDRPLTEREMGELRALSTRAEITATSFVNEYHYGDFRGDPHRLMEKYFDAFLYVANWGTHWHMLRLPRRLVDLPTARLYAVDECLTLHEHQDHVVIEFEVRDEDGGEWEEGEGQLGPLIPLRNDLMAGDLRALYLGWLAAVDWGGLDDDTAEPPVPLGLNQLTGSLQALANFLWIDPSLIAVAAEGAEGKAPAEPTAEALAAWTAGLSPAEKNSLLLRLVQGEGAFLGLELRRRFLEAQAERRGRSPASSARRTVAELRAARDRRAEEESRRTAEKQVREQARRAREKAEERARHLDSLVGNEAKLWKQVETAIATKQAKQYDLAVKLLRDLAELGQRTGNHQAIAQRIRQIRQQHHGKWSFIRKLDNAGLPS